MKLIDALWDQIHDNEIGLINDYDLFKLYSALIKAKNYEGTKLHIRNSSPELSQFKRFRSSMIRKGFLRPAEREKSSVYRISGGATYSIEDYCCYADPFCYISHFSALQRYRLTNRNPQHLTLSTPNRSIWNKKRLSLIDAEISNQQEQIIALQLLKKISFKQKIKNRPILVHETSSPDETITIKNSATRIPKIGELFNQTLDKPQWCGGIIHVLEIWDTHAKDYLNEIIASISTTSSKIVKVRAGYILEERLGITDQRINKWVTAAERGSSRKLDPETPYNSFYSEKWMLSINV